LVRQGFIKYKNLLIIKPVAEKMPGILITKKAFSKTTFFGARVG